MDIRDFRDKHRDEQAFLIGNGPSLSRTPLHKLTGEVTIAMNNIHRIYPETEWRPEYYVSVQSPEPKADPSKAWIDECVRGPMATANLDIPSFFASVKGALFPRRDNIVYLDKTELDTDTNVMLHMAAEEGDIDDIWSRDLETGVYRRHTSMYAAAQLASYMGCTKLYFVGSDLYPEFKPYPHKLFDGGSDAKEYNLQPHAPGERGYVDFLLQEGAPVRSAINGALYKSLRQESLMRQLYRLYEGTGFLRDDHFTTGSREAHFVGDYNTRIYNGNEFILYGTNRKLRVVHKVIRAIGELVGFDTFNATLGGQLEVHPRVDLNEVVS